jgi:hypothetical protein
VLAVLLVLLVAAAAAYAVFLRPLNELVINAGALVLGVWGIRSILESDSAPGATALDLALSVVIVFLLGAITVRALIFLDERSEMRVLKRERWAGRFPQPHRAAGNAAPQPPLPPSDSPEGIE